MEAEVAQSQLSAAYDKFPQLAGQNAQALRDLNTELMRKTKFDDDATASAQANLAQYGLTQDQLLKITPLLQDYAEKTGKDLPTAATDLGKAILGQGRALKGIGINFKDTGTAAGNFDQLVGGLTDKVGGFAEVAGGTSAGKIAILKNQFGELQEKIGSALVPILGKLADGLSAVMRWIEENQGTAQVLAAVVGGVLTAAFVAWGASVIAATWPIIAIGAAVAALVAGVIYAYTHWGWFRDAVDAVAKFLTDTLWPALQQIWAFIKDNLIPIIAAVIQAYIDFYSKVAEVAFGVVDVFVGVVEWFSKLPEAIASAFSRLADIISSPFTTAFAAIKRLWNDTVGGFGFDFAGWDPPGPGSVPGISFTIPKMHNGGIFQAPGGRREGLALLKSGEQVLTREQQGGVVINVNGRIDQSTIADLVYQQRRLQVEMAG